MLASLIENYMTDKIRSTGLLTDAMYSRPAGHEPECCIWGDYYFMEALVRAATDNKWRMYW
jgi:unsaturated chondroitin disaccharide hydrolase